MNKVSQSKLVESCNAEPVLSFRGVSKSYGTTLALNELDLEVQKGERVAVLGENGAGKSTFISISAGVCSVDAGEVSVLSKKARDPSMRFRRAFLPQELKLPAFLKCQEVLSFLAAHYKTSFPHSIVEKLGLGKLMKRKCSELSGGEERKVAWVGTLLSSAELLFMDEPTANIDLSGRIELFELLDDYLKEASRTLVFSSHDMNEVERLAERVVLLKSGRSCFDGSLSELKSQCRGKKLRFHSESQNEFHPVNAKILSRQGDFYTLVGADSDAMLKEVLQWDTHASSLSLEKTPLSEVIQDFWNKAHGEARAHAKI